MVLFRGGTSLVHGNPGWPLGVRCAVRLAPLLPLVLYIHSWARFVQGLEELQRGLQTYAFLFTSLITHLVSALLRTLAEQGARIRWIPLGVGGLLFCMAVLWPVSDAS